MASGTNLGKAYVQIVPTTKGISDSISDALMPGSEEAGKGAGKSLMSSLVGSLSKIGVVIGIGKILKDTITEGGNLEQSLGGIETIYGKHFQQVQKNAETAYKRANLSQNAYQELATGFGAALLQSTKGNTEASAKAFDTMVVDMADNANKMGTPLELIQNAYNGFAKQNYTMLDNLKLGYGGTKNEMMRLLADAEKLTGVKYDINSLKDIGEAIHAIQTNLKITGTTAKESAETLLGSWNSMTSAFTNFLGKLAMGEGAGRALMDLLGTVSTFLIGNLLLMIWNILKQIPSMIYTVISEGIPQWLERGKSLIVNLINGIAENAPNLLNKMLEVLKLLIIKIVEYLPNFLQKGIEIVLKMIVGIVQALPQIITSIKNLLSKLIYTIASRLPEFLAKGLELVAKLALGIIQNIPYVVSKISTVISAILNEFGALLSGIYNVGVNLIKGLWNGIGSVVGWIRSKISGFASSILSSIKGFFGIHSPSRVFRDEIGAMLGQGLALGITDEVSTVSKAMDKIENEVMRDMSNDFDFNSNGNLKLNAKINDSELTLDNNRPLEVKLNMGGNTFRAFRETINTANDKDMELELAY